MFRCLRRPLGHRLQVLFLLLFCFFALETRGGFPDPEKSGFHHCVLIYDRPTRADIELLPYVAALAEESPRQWLFDAFLFLMPRTPLGRSTTRGGTTKADWEGVLDRWFAEGRDLAALSGAIGMAGKRLGGPPTPRKVILMIPYPGPGAEPFGDIAGDGKNTDLASPEGVHVAVQWYVKQVVSRFRKAGLDGLELWGFYWMKEAISTQDQTRVKAAVDAIHDAGFKLLWIPWFRANGWERWADCGIDVAIMQPNYAFFSKHGGTVRKNRLALTADLASKHGLGIEIELPMAYDDPAAARYFLDYLAFGAASRHGYQQGTTAYYLGREGLNRLHDSRHAWQRDLFNSLAGYVGGKEIENPSPKVEWRADGFAAPALGDGNLKTVQQFRHAVSLLPDNQDCRRVSVLLDGASGHAAFCGMVRAELRTSSGSWAPAGWSLYPGAGDPPEAFGATLSVPVHGVGDAVRVILEPLPSFAYATAREIEIDPGSSILGRKVDSLLTGCSYKISPERKSQYGDSGGELTDGILSGGFASGRTVGWHGGEVAIRFNTGKSVPVDRVEVVVDGGGYASVNWPSQGLLMVSADNDMPIRSSGISPCPDRLSWMAAEGRIVPDVRRGSGDATGRMVFLPPAPLVAQFVQVVLKGGGWLMVSEIRIFSRGENVALDREYELFPIPSPAGNVPYPDDGILLADGVVAQTFSPSMVTGQNSGGQRTITGCLREPAACGKITVWALAGGLHGICAPARVVISVSKDGTTWREVGASDRPTSLEENNSIFPLPYTVELDEEDREGTVSGIRATVLRKRGWAMISEVQVE